MKKQEKLKAEIKKIFNRLLNIRDSKVVRLILYFPRLYKIYCWIQDLIQYI